MNPVDFERIRAKGLKRLWIRVAIGLALLGALWLCIVWLL